MKFYSITSLRKDLSKYLKKDCYTNCDSDLCNFFAGRPMGEIFELAEVVAPSQTCKFIKSRISNENMNKGKSGCYRIYFFADIEKHHVYLMGFYPKTGPHGREDLSHQERKQLIKQFSN